MPTIIKTVPTHPDFLSLVKLLDADLVIRDGEDHFFYNQFNGLSTVTNAVVVYEDSQAVACGALKIYDAETMEIKRMYTKPEFRGKGFASLVLKELEAIARSESYKQTILETGLKQPEAIALYLKNEYVKIPNYGQYEDVEMSVCFQKML